MRVILDTSVLISAVRSPYGASQLLVDQAVQGDFQILLSVPLTFEYESVLTRSHHMAQSGLSEEQIATLIATLLRVAIKVDLNQYSGPYSIDPNDNHVLSLALQGQADAIVTHNLRHFSDPSKALGVGLYTPGDALRLLRS